MQIVYIAYSVSTGRIMKLLSVNVVEGSGRGLFYIVISVFANVGLGTA
jgi:hypothetical protein